MASNGNSMTRTANDNDKLQYNARLMWQPNGSQVLNQRAWVTGALYSESDFESTTTPIYALAVNWENQNNFNATTATIRNGTPSASTASSSSRASPPSACIRWPSGPGNGCQIRRIGFNVQAGQLFSRRRFEIAVRYAESDPSDLVSNNKQTEIRGAFSYYYARHGLKWQNDFGQVKRNRGPRPRR